MLLIQARQRLSAASPLDVAVEPGLVGERPASSTAMVSAQVQVATASSWCAVDRPRQAMGVLAGRGGLSWRRCHASCRWSRPMASSKHDEAVTPHLQALNELSPRHRFARQAFNDAVGAYNHAIGQFPTRLPIRAFGFERAGEL